MHTGVHTHPSSPGHEGQQHPGSAEAGGGGSWEGPDPPDTHFQSLGQASNQGAQQDGTEGEREWQERGSG